MNFTTLRILLLVVSLCSMSLGGFAQTIKIWPKTGVGSGVTYGADVKLTMFRIDPSDYSSIIGKMKNDLQMDLVRVPMVAQWGTGDNRHLEVRDFAQEAKNQGLDVFLSVANTNGTFKPNGDLDDGHGVHKFASWMLCNGCANPGTYNVNLDKYKDWMQILVNDKIGANLVDYLGPWNEDGAYLNDYTSLDIGIPVVGVEVWGLGSAPARYTNVNSAIDVAGAHNYVSSGTPNLLNAYTEWQNFANAGSKPEWFTETTLFAKSTAEGIAHMLPPISVGIEKMIIYQTVTRQIWANGGNATHWNATKELIDYSKGKGSARQVETNSRYGVVASFKEGTDLHVHLCNVDATQRTMYINLQQGYTVSSTAQQAYGGTVTTTIKNGGAQLEVVIPAKTYVRITASGLAAAPTYSFIDHNSSGYRLRADPNTEVVSTVSSGSTGTWVQWSEEESNNGYFYLVHRASGKKLNSSDGYSLSLVGASTTSNSAQWRWVDAGSGWHRLEHRQSGNWLHVKPDGTSDFRLGPTSWTGDNTKWQPNAAPVRRMVDQTEHFKLYPNPSNSGAVQLEITSDGPCMMNLIDLQGRRLDTQSLAGPGLYKFNFGHLPAGTYLCQFIQDGQSHTQRLILQ
ncbi:T9SS type A sorting domain-containing protein [Pontibacter sp. G13]|uniref:T9SS type A sorting domain-containing protein n=1 Tax=Pontibacter sp. G13 TaxID=3074898 RepID=UPI00288A8357|nr:T9SS type A sorting domain-containing protein [Pontibacter sp. G13]WNJ20620.1 T9SS type A sorting domain-containing protein [Pontibacter sp. G13]